jgi:cell division septal protein FtsQ
VNNIKTHKTPKTPRRRVSEFEQRLLEKRRIVRLMLLKKLFRFFLIFAIILGLIWGVLYSPLFKITAVEFVGLDDQTFPVYVDKSALEKISQQFSPQDSPSMLTFNKELFQEQLLNVSGIKNVDIAMEWANHKVVAVLVPREPIAVINHRLVDIDGVELAGEVKDKFYPNLEVSQEAKKDTLLLYNAIRNEKLDIVSGKAQTRDDISFTQKSGMILIFGNTNQLTLKLAGIHKILENDIIKDKKVLDVSSPTSPVAK